MASFLNLFFFAFHTALIFFNLFGWSIPRLRRWNLATLLLTLFSWVVLGIWYGFGYCPCTDWHWDVRRQLGHYDMPSSYIKFLADSITGMNWSASIVDTWTGILFAAALVCSLWLNIRDLLNKKKQNRLPKA
jgi:hypothetical protein